MRPLGEAAVDCWGRAWTPTLFCPSLQQVRLHRGLLRSHRAPCSPGRRRPSLGVRRQQDPSQSARDLPGLGNGGAPGGGRPPAGCFSRRGGDE